MADQKFELRLDLNLKRISNISVAEILWKLPDVTYEIRNLSNEPAFRNLHDYGKIIRKPRKYELWEQLINIVCKKSRLLLLPHNVEEELQKIIILVGEKVFYFYSWKCHECKWCTKSIYPENKESIVSSLTRLWNFVFFPEREADDTENKAKNDRNLYTFSSQGVLRLQCSSLHWKYTPKNDEEFLEFLDNALLRCDEKIIQKYQDRIMADLKSEQPLNFENLEDITFNVISVWYFMFYPGQRLFRRAIPDNSSLNSDYIIPPEAVYTMCCRSLPSPGGFLKIFLKKFPDLLSELDVSLIAKQYLANYISSLVESPKNVFAFRFENLSAEYFLFFLRFLSQDQLCELFQKYLNTVVIVLLPVWPYLGFVPKILDFCFEKNLDVNFEFLLEFVTMAIAFENMKVYSGKKTEYLVIFRMLWRKAPEKDKFLFLKKIIKSCVLNKVKFPILEEDDYDKNEEDLNDFVEMKCNKLSILEITELVINFLGQVVVSQEEGKAFNERYINKDFLDFQIFAQLIWCNHDLNVI